MTARKTYGPHRGESALFTTSGRQFRARVTQIIGGKRWSLALIGRIEPAIAAEPHTPPKEAP